MTSSQPDPSHLSPPRKGDAMGERDDMTDHRNPSFYNLTSSTLSGIYAPTALEQPSEPQTPWGTGAETPARKGSIDLSSRGRDNSIAELEARLLKTTGRPDMQRRKKSGRHSPDRDNVHHAPRPWYSVLAATLLRGATLFLFGVAYGALVAHLHDNRHMAPVKVDAIDHASWGYLVFWGLSGVGLGSLLPWVDFLWENGTPGPDGQRDDEDGLHAASAGQRKRGGLPVEWNDVVRSVGAFVGVAFAIRKLSWSSTLQLSATLGLVNPFLWYLLDRTRTGFTLSTLVGLLGTALLFATNPAMIPPPAPLQRANDTRAYLAPPAAAAAAGPRIHASGTAALEALMQSESVAVAAWTASVLFCSCVCFGNIGRLLVTGKR